MNYVLIILILIPLYLTLILNLIILKDKNKEKQLSYLETLPKSLSFTSKPLQIIFHPNIKYQSYQKVKEIIYTEIYKIEKDSKRKFNLEHIVPQSYYGKDPTVKKDMHNLIIYPKDLNSHRSNYKYVSDTKIYDESIILNDSGDKVKFKKPLKKNNSIKNNKKKIFHPRDEFKGQIARACMYFIRVYNWDETVFKYVIDPYTILLWHHQYPVTEFEKSKNEIILKYQKNENKYVSNPKRLVSDMETLLRTKLTSFKDYEYN